jgi:DNA-binding transcriptional LysR family regulator
MTTTAPSWELYRTFLAVLEEGSLSGAARATGLAQPTVGRHIDALEAALETALFTRSQHGLAPTEAAIDLRPYAVSLRSTADALLRAASGRTVDAAGTVRVTASEMVGTQILPAILREIRDSYPGIAIELVVSNRNQDLLQRGADIAVRMARPTQEALVARRVGAVALGLHAHRDYLAKHGIPHGAADIAAHTLIGFDTETEFARGVDLRGVPLRREMFALRTDSDVAQFAAIVAGYGIGICQVGLARRHPELVPVLRDEFGISLECWIAMHEDLRAVRRCRVVFDALAEGMATYIAAGC